MVFFAYDLTAGLAGCRNMSICGFTVEQADRVADAILRRAVSPPGRKPEP